ncbi:hypothetical protein G7Y79_00027g061160 [Physcia stellaris]|nr:hypothetical protein G7Y79_00027g061160 [Physcia stellaris]
MNNDILPTPTADANINDDYDEQRSYDHLLPASYRTSEDDLASPALTTSFLLRELQVKRLNDIHQWLWIVGRPAPPRPLYKQKALGRHIIVHEQADLHLVWDEQRIFLKPIPRFLLEPNVWRDILRCKHGNESVPFHGHTEHLNEHQLKYERAGETARAEASDDNSGSCLACQARALATGFLLSYTALISYEHDLHIAQDHDLVPTSITWPQWRQTVKSILASQSSLPSNSINPRYHYGELRLSRLNRIYTLTLRAPIRGYLYGYNTYHSFWDASTKRLAAAFAYIIVVLTAMQAGLATDKLQQSEAFQRVSYGFTVFSIAAPLGMLGVAAVVFVAVFVVNWMGAVRYWKERMAWIEGRGRRREHP